MAKMSLPLLVLSLLTVQIHFQIGETIRNIRYTIEFPDPGICPGITTNETRNTYVRVETGSTGLDVMIAAADKNQKFNFQTTYSGNRGFFIDSLAGTPDNNPCFWFFYYVIPGVPGDILSSLGISRVIPGNGWRIIWRYELYVPPHP